MRTTLLVLLGSSLFLGLACGSADTARSANAGEVRADAPDESSVNARDEAVTATAEPAGASGDTRVVEASAGTIPCRFVPEGPRVVLIECGVYSIKAMKPSSVAFADIFREFVPNAGWVPTTVTVAGKPVEGAVLDGRASGDRIGVAAAGEPNGTRLFLTCFGPANDSTETSCRRIVDHFLTNGLPAGVVFEGTKLLVGGRELTVPEGCAIVPDQNRIRCPHGELDWREANPSCRMTPDQQRAAFELMMSRAGPSTHSRVKCRAFGAEHDCDRWVLTQPGRASATVVALLRGCAEPTLQCNIHGADTGQFPPPPCDQVFEPLTAE